MQTSFDEIRLKIDDLVQRLQTDTAFQEQMKENPEDALISAGLGDEAAVILADDWRGAMGDKPMEAACQSQELMPLLREQGWRQLRRPLQRCAAPRALQSVGPRIVAS